MFISLSLYTLFIMVVFMYIYSNNIRMLIKMAVAISFKNVNKA